MEKILVGRITSPVGLRGEVKVWNYSDRTQIYEETEKFYLGDDLRSLENFRPHKNMLVMKFEGIDTREDAERMRDVDIFVTREDLPELEDGEVYIRDMVGMDVVSSEETIGKVEEVISNTSQDLLRVRTAEGKESLIPCIKPIVSEIDLEKRRITVDLPEGLLEL